MNPQAIASEIAKLPSSKQAAVRARLKWLKKARPKQIPPNDRDWFAFFVRSGRGFGKTKLCAEDSWWYCAWNDGVRLAVVAPTNSDLRRTVFEGESGLLASAPPEVLAGDNAYNVSTAELQFANGSIIQGFSSESYNRLRGPQFHRAWCEEMGSWPYLQPTWDMLMFGLRLGDKPRAVISTTPKPFPLIKELSARDDVVLVTGSTYENKENLAPSFLELIEKQYSGTRLGQQEIQGDILDDVPGALWTWPMIERARWSGALPPFTYIVVAVDPSVGELTKRGTERRPDQDECGIVVCALGRDGYGYVLYDRSMTGTPDEWAQVVADTYAQAEAHWVVAEKNQGGALVASVLKAKNPNIPIRLVSASKGKRTRAEPISMLYEQNRIRHIGVFPDLETQMTQWSPTESEWSPDRMDALVWGFTKLMVDKPGEFFVGVV